MKKIYLFCSNGMSTSLLAQNMQDVANAHNLPFEVKAFPIGTLVSGVTFLISAQLTVGLPANFSMLFITIVIPAVLINTIGGFILYHVISLSLKRIITL